MCDTIDYATANSMGACDDVKYKGGNSGVSDIIFESQSAEIDVGIGEKTDIDAIFAVY